MKTRRPSRWYEYPPFIDSTHRITYELECGHDRWAFYDRDWRKGTWWCRQCRRTRHAVGRRQGWGNDGTAT